MHTPVKTLITGINGFTGQYLAASLREAGHEVYGTTESVPAGDYLFQASLHDPNSLSKVLKTVRPDYIVHLAARAFVGDRDAAAFYQTNLLGTLHLMQAIEQTSPDLRHLIVASSANVYGNNPVSPCGETAAPAPANDYAVSKLAMESMLALWRDRVPFTVVRPFNYTGKGQSSKFLIPKIVSHFRETQPAIELGNIDVWRDFSDVRSVVACYRQLLDTPAQGETYNVCSGTLYSIRQIIDLCQKITGHELEITQNPAFMRANEIKQLQGDNQKLKTILPDFAVIPLEETLKWMLS